MRPYYVFYFLPDPLAPDEVPDDETVQAGEVLAESVTDAVSQARSRLLAEHAIVAVVEPAFMRAIQYLGEIADWTR